MYEIVRRYTPEVEEYSIDECFADITGMRHVNNMTYGEIVRAVKDDLESELGMTFSLGLAPNKVLSKIGSKWNKPSGITLIPGKLAHEYLVRTPVEDIWGIGKQTSLFLRKFRVADAYQLATASRAWVEHNLSKPYHELHRELSGELVFPLDLETRRAPKSISKTKTFTPPSVERDFVFSELSKNIENACIKARRYGLFSKVFSVYIKTQYFRFRVVEFTLSRAVNTPNLIVSRASGFFDEMFDASEKYRGSGVVMKELEYQSSQADLFGESAEVEKYEKVYASVDQMREKYGKHTLFLGSSFEANKGRRVNHRKVSPERNSELLKGENTRMRVDIPWLGHVK
jgi:DNA polymerase-4/DNA polymerase V